MADFDLGAQIHGERFDTGCEAAYGFILSGTNPKLEKSYDCLSGRLHLSGSEVASFGDLLCSS